MRMINFIIIILYFCSGKNLYFSDVQRITVETINQLPNMKDKVALFLFFCNLSIFHIQLNPSF